MENNTVSADNTNIKNSTGGGGIRRKRITRKYGKSRVNKRKHRRSLKKKMKKSIKKTRQYRKNRTMRKARRGGVTPEERARRLKQIAEIQARLVGYEDLTANRDNYHFSKEQRKKQIDDILGMREGQRNLWDRLVGRSMSKE